MPRQDRAWVARLTAGEQVALAQSEEFFQSPDGRLRKMLSRVSRPFDALLRATPQGFQDAVGNTLHGVLTTVATGAEGGDYQRELVDLICARSGQELDPWQRIFTVDLAVLESIVNSKIRSAKGMAVVQGGLTGLGGAPGLLADIPTLYFLLFRTVHQVAICFGYPADNDAERRYLLQVVNAGHHLEWRDRRCALMELDALEAQVENRNSSSEDMQRTLLAKSVQQLAKKLAATLVTRKAAQTVALVGGAVGAVINRQLLDDVGQASFHAYRRRFLYGVAEARIGKRLKG
jgi:hypothetical protein